MLLTYYLELKFRVPRFLYPNIAHCWMNRIITIGPYDGGSASPVIIFYWR